MGATEIGTFGVVAGVIMFGIDFISGNTPDNSIIVIILGVVLLVFGGQ